MTADRAPKEAKENNTRQRETQAQDKPFQFEASPTLRLDPANILHLQRTIGNQAVQRLMAWGSSTAPHHQSRPAANIQRFGGQEHKMYGDWGVFGQNYGFEKDGSIASADFAKTTQFRLTHGDITMLTGDYFPPELLFELAKKPSSDPGKQSGTQDEIIYAIYDNNAQDLRFQPLLGEWHGIEFSDKVKEAVDNRYLQLAARNDEHFSNPQGQGFEMVTSERGITAGGSYRALHEAAITRAFIAGQNNQDIANGLAYEAAAQHFLTDQFSAGHVRTPRDAIRQYWRARYPNFFNNFKKKIAYDVAYYMNENETNLATIGGTVNAIFQETHATLEEKTAALPALGFDDLIGRVAHDVDNEHGVWVVNDLGIRWKTFGDSHLVMSPDNPDDRTFEMGQLAVRLGADDIYHAYELGKQYPGPYADDWILRTVRAQASSPAVPGDRYAPEQVVPRLDPEKDNGTQKWRAASVEDLWGVNVRSDVEETYGDAITYNLKEGEIGSILSGMADKFPEEQEVWTDTFWGYQLYSGTLHPRAAFIHGFLDPLVEGDSDSVLQGLQSIINFSPSLVDDTFHQDDSIPPEKTDLEKLQDLILDMQQNQPGFTSPLPPVPAVPERLYFRFDRPQGEESLEEVVRSDQDLMPLRELALWTQRVKGAEIALEGHASSEGPEYLNHNLGLARASLIELFLLENGADLDNNRVTTDTRGEEGAEAKPDWRYVQISVRGTPTATQQPNGSTGQ